MIAATELAAPDDAPGRSAPTQPRQTPSAAPAGGEVAVPAGELWRLVLRAFCGAGMPAVIARIGAVWEAPPTQIDATIAGLMNASITALPAHVVAAIEQALQAPEGAGDMKQPARKSDIDEDPSAGEAQAPIEAGAPRTPDSIVQLAGRRPEPGPVRRWPFPCGLCDDGTGFETASARVGHLREVHRVCGECDHAPFATAGRLRRHVAQFHQPPARGPAARPRPQPAYPGARTSGPAGGPTSIPEPAHSVRREPFVASAEDLETEALAVGTRQLQRLEPAAIRRVLDYWAQRFADIDGLTDPR